MDDPTAGHEGSGSDTNDEDSPSYLQATRDSVIFLIDATVNMFESKYESPSIRMALQGTLNMLKTKILTSDYDLMAVVLFGTNESEAPKDIGNYPNTYVLQDLVRPEVDIIRRIEDLINSDDCQDLRKLTTDPPVYALADALWLCNSMFSKRCKGRESKRLFIFTDNDDPYNNNAALKKQAERRAADIRDANIDLLLFPMNPDFSVSKFYKDILAEEGVVAAVPVGSIEDLLDKVRRRVHKKRTAGKLLFDLGKDVKFSVGLYNLIRPAPNPKRVTLDARTNEPVKSVTTRFNAVTGDVLLTSELTKYVQYRDEKIQMDPLDIKRIKNMYSPGFKLLGFKPIEKIKSTYFYNPSPFIYPDEEVIKGSSLLFGSLLDRCAARRVAPVCRFVANRSRSPRMVALLPQLEEKSESGEQTKPPGFHVFYLPFVDDFRTLPCREFVGPVPTGEEDEEPEPWRASPEQMDAAKTVVSKLRSDNFDVGQIPDPALHKKWGYIEAAALQTDNTNEDKVEDLTQPDESKLLSKLDHSDEDLLSLVYPVGYSPEESVSRTTGSHGSRSSARKEIPAADVEAEVKAGRVKKLTVEILKHYLQSKGVTHLSGKKKDELIQLTLEQCEK